MRFVVPMTVIVFVLMLSLAAPLDAKGGKGGGGGRGKSGGGAGKWSGQQSKPGGRKAGNVKPEKHQVAQGAQKPARDKIEKHGKPDKQHAVDSDPADDDDQGGNGTAEPTPSNKKQKQLANFQRQRDKKLAQAEHLRQISEKNGNANLAANADRMEAQAHDQYAQKVAHLEKFGVTDLELNPDGGITDPLAPSTDPLFPVGSY
jgi:hypothetical protein